MRSLMVVVPDEVLNGPAPRGKREERPDVEAFVVNRPKEPLDFAIRLWRVRFEYVMANVERRTHLLKTCQAIRVMGVAHRKGHRVIRQHRFDAIRQRPDD